MTREQLEHVIRVAAANADTDEVVVVGSQAILGTLPSPAQKVLVRSVEADVFPLNHPERSILIDGAIGEKSVFHETLLPAGWRDRLVPVRSENTRDCTGWCLELHDLAVSKLAAGREKDMEFLRGMQTEGVLNAATFKDRIKATTFTSPEQAELAFARYERLLSPES